jgi:Protein of unknown function (DUF4199)
MKKTILNTGLLSGAAISVIMGVAMAYYTHNPTADHSLMMGYAAMVVALSLIFFGLRSYRDKQNGGSLTLATALGMGLLMAAIASAIYVATWAVEYKYFFPDFMDQYAAHAIEKAKASGMAQAMLDKQTAEMAKMKEDYKNPVYFTIMTFAEIFPVGILVSLISALILKRK